MSRAWITFSTAASLINGPCTKKTKKLHDQVIKTIMRIKQKLEIKLTLEKKNQAEAQSNASTKQ